MVCLDIVLSVPIHFDTAASLRKQYAVRFVLFSNEVLLLFEYMVSFPPTAEYHPEFTIALGILNVNIGIYFVCFSRTVT